MGNRAGQIWSLHGIRLSALLSHWLTLHGTWFTTFASESSWTKAPNFKGTRNKRRTFLCYILGFSFFICFKAKYVTFAHFAYFMWYCIICSNSHCGVVSQCVFCHCSIETFFANIKEDKMANQKCSSFAVLESKT